MKMGFESVIMKENNVIGNEYPYKERNAKK